MAKTLNGRLSTEEMIPRKVAGDSFSEAAIRRRLDWIGKTLGIKLSTIPDSQFDVTSAKRNVENYIGTVRIPIGLSGPILVNGQHAKGLFYVPMATTEGTLIDGYTRGMIAVTEAGGAKTLVEKDEIHISPPFQLRNMEEIKPFIAWVEKHFLDIKKAAESTTHHGKLLRIRPFILTSDRVALQMFFFTEDAMGLTIMVLATAAACDYISKTCSFVKKYYLRSNVSSDKKASLLNYIEGYGKSVLASVDFQEKIVRRYFHSTPEQIYDFWYGATLGGMQGGIVGSNAHIANGLAAIYTATGQDLAHIVNASVAMNSVEVIPGGLRITVRLPSLILGTIGGGTSLSTQRESLEIMNCYGSGKALKFSEIVAATLLAGESSILASLSSGTNFVSAHQANRSLLK